MKPTVTILSSMLLIGSWAAAEADPFQRGAPEQSLPSLRAAGTPAPVVASPASVAPAAPQTMAGSLASAIGVQPGFGNPRSSSDGGTTRVVFDLPNSVNYSLTPTFGGLRIDIEGARVIPAVTARMGSSVSEYRAGAGQITLVTPFPLSPTDGWRAYEATIAGGTKVLILEFGATLSGGAGNNVRGKVLTTAPATSPAVQATLNKPIEGIEAGVSGATPASSTAGLPPGDTIRTGPVLPPAPALPGAESDKPSALMGRVPGTPVVGASLGAPRVGKNPGQTRMVLDLPAGASYRIVPGTIGLRVELTGVTIGAITTAEQDVSSEVRAWRYEPTSTGVNVTFVTGSPTTVRSGWRAQLLPPSNSDRSRLAIDFSPAIADTTPLTAREKQMAIVPPLKVNSGTAILALAASYAKPRVVLDPGHGGKDPGAIGSIVEKEVTLDVALRVRDLLQAAGVDVTMTRTTDTQLHADKNTDLNMRAAMGNNATQMYVSIHVNAIAPQNVLRGYGIETWWNPNHPMSQNLASLLQKNMLLTTAAADQGLHNTRSLAVLRNSKIPAALVEIGFTSHPVDGLNLKDTNYLDRVALGIANGIRDALLSGVTASGTVLRGGVGGGDK